MRDRLFGFGQARGNGLAHAVEGDFLERAAFVDFHHGVGGRAGGRGRCGCRCAGGLRAFGRFGFGATGGGCLHICFDDATMRARAGEFGQVHAFVCRDATGQRCHKQPFAVTALGRGGGGFACVVGVAFAAAVAFFRGRVLVGGIFLGAVFGSRGRGAVNV